MAYDAPHPAYPARGRRRMRQARVSGTSWRTRLLAGGTDGNERLTVFAGLLLIVLFTAVGVTIIRIGQLLWLHLFLGLLLLGPVALKLGSIGYRFTRYYTSAPAYREKGPPPPALRGLAPLLIFFTLALFGTGVALLLLGPGSRQPLVLLHKLSFFAWIAVAGLHVLGHLPEIRRVMSRARGSRREVLAAYGGRLDERTPEPRTTVPGRQGRGAALIVALLVGLAVAVGLIGQFAVWTH